MKFLVFLIAMIILFAFAAKPASAIDWVMDDKKIVIVNQTEPLSDAETAIFDNISTISAYLPAISYLYISRYAYAGGTFLELYKEKLKRPVAKIPNGAEKLLGIGVSKFNNSDNSENKIKQFEQAVKNLIRSITGE